MSQETFPGAPESDEREIRELIGRLSDSWARDDAQAYGAVFTEDCDYVAFDGGGFAVQPNPALTSLRLFNSVLKDSRLEGEVESVAIHHSGRGGGALDWLRGVSVATARETPSAVATDACHRAPGWSVAGDRVPKHAGAAVTSRGHRVRARVTFHPLAGCMGAGRAAPIARTVRRMAQLPGSRRP
jgi:uncharacterized protein (TIGR02246 family)